MIPKYQHQYIKDALWISYSGLKDFLKCPRSYYLKNRYRNPKTGNRILVTSPYLTLGNLVHEAIRWYLITGRGASQKELEDKFRNHWLKYRGKRGGFVSWEQEAEFGNRGLKLLDNFLNNAVKLEKSIPVYDFLKLKLDEGIILNGKVDFIGEFPDGSLHILDFKTGSKDEEDSMQLHTYAILAESNLQRPVSKISYWYLERESSPKEAVLDPLEEKLKWLKNKALEIQEAVAADVWVCKEGKSLCNDCRNYQAVIEGKAEFQFSDENFKKDVFYLQKEDLLNQDLPV